MAERAVRVLEDAGLCRTVPADQVLRAHPSRPAGARAARITPEGRDALAYRLGRADPDRLIDLIDHNEVTPAVNQIETHPFFQRTADQSASDIRLHTMRVRDSFSCARTPQVRGGS